MSRLDDCYNVFDLREVAKRRLPKAVFEFVDRSTEDELALRNNRAAFEKIKLKHRSLVDVSGRSTRSANPAGSSEVDDTIADRWPTKTRSPRSRPSERSRCSILPCRDATDSEVPFTSTASAASAAAMVASVMLCWLAS